MIKILEKKTLLEIKGGQEEIKKDEIVTDNFIDKGGPEQHYLRLK
jgi:hypothetical protein